MRIFGQRVFAASAVHPLRGAADETRWLGPSTVAEATLGALPDPEYFVAICGRNESTELPDLCSVYLDPRDELLADIRSGGLASGCSGGQTVLEAPVQPGVLTSAPLQIDDEAELQLAALRSELAKVECELTERVNQVKSLEAHTAAELAQERETATRLESVHQQEHQVFAARVAELEQIASEAHERQAALERAIESLTVEREQLEAILTERGEVDFELATVREENLELRRETERLVAQLKLERLNDDELAQRTHQAESVLAEVLGSTSWRVTLPARRLMGALRRRDKR